jgi:hypothetical protein
MAYYNAHTRQWDERPSITGPIELYRPTEDGTENLPADANIDVEYFGEYPDINAAVDAIDCCGRWLISTSDRGSYTGHLNSVPGGIELTIY